MDNLNSHKHAIIAAMILGAGHRLIFRAPYYPVDGPIEYFFNTIQNLLCIQMREIHGMDSLRQKIIDIVGSIDEFSSYFRHVGFNY